MKKTKKKKKRFLRHVMSRKEVEAVVLTAMLEGREREENRERNLRKVGQE